MLFRHIKRIPILFAELSVGSWCRYYGVISTMHGTKCKVINLRRNGKIDVKILDGPRAGSTRRGLRASMLGQYEPEDVSWEL